MAVERAPRLSELRERVAWLSPVETDDGAGGSVLASFAASGSTWAAVVAAPAGEERAAGAVRSAVSLDLMIRALSDPGLGGGWRATWKGRTFEVLSVVPLAGGDWLRVTLGGLGDVA